MKTTPNCPIVEVAVEVAKLLLNSTEKRSNSSSVRTKTATATVATTAAIAATTNIATTAEAARTTVISAELHRRLLSQLMEKRR